MHGDSQASQPSRGDHTATRLEFLETRERFLPVEQAALRERMLCDPRLSTEERERLGQLFEMVACRFHFEFRKKLEHLQTAYRALDPDRETVPPISSDVEEAASREGLPRALERLLLDANYVEMPREQILACVEHQSQAGLVVQASLADYTMLRVFYRGVRREPRKFRPWLTPWSRQSETVHVLSRVAMMLETIKHPGQPVFVKLFKNVVAEDLEMLLPHVRIRMRLVDHVKIGSSVAGGVVTAAWKAFTAAILSPWVFMLLMFTFVGAMVRGAMSFFSRKASYLQALTANLYFQNLANNSSALAHLVETAEAEECKELLLAYYLLYAERNRQYTQEDLDRRVEQWLRMEFGLEVDFEAADAIRKLQDKGILVRRPSAALGEPGKDAVLKVYDLPSTLRRLDESWDGYFTYGGTRTPGEDRVADGEWPPFDEPRAVGDAA